MAEKVTVMMLKADLHCPCCHKKVKKILCGIPQIRGQIYDVKQNTVTINVVCCSPEKIRDKLCCKGGKVIKNIEIKGPEEEPASGERSGCRKKPGVVVPTSPKETELSDPPSTPPANVTGPFSPGPLARTCCAPCSEGHAGGPCYRGNPAPSGPPPPPTKVAETIPPYPPTRTCCASCSEGYGGGPCYHGYPAPPCYMSPKEPVVTKLPPPARTCCGPCSEGYGGGPCYHGPAPSCNDGYYGYGYGRECSCGCGCSYGTGCHLRKCACYIEENPTAECKIM
ncbi:pollen-specific leucine-rich repeat extensin 1 [Olea europaea subsp. europaea]|uniref:Pollen-specific leucine-rich repeat extensin 1 n=2 Tax=Olea europaea subsp. europaea TaxID=158383 RepID=A0A8S0SMX3_OLEEU|nr:pollen-specific leucine-rich repeat extensin 1 [Olea europaea subsp. europaea]